MTDRIEGAVPPGDGFEAELSNLLDENERQVEAARAQRQSELTVLGALVEQDAPWADAFQHWLEEHPEEPLGALIADNIGAAESLETIARNGSHERADADALMVEAKTLRETTERLGLAVSIGYALTEAEVRGENPERKADLQADIYGNEVLSQAEKERWAAAVNGLFAGPELDMSDISSVQRIESARAAGLAVEEDRPFLDDLAATRHHLAPLLTDFYTANGVPRQEGLDALGDGLVQTITREAELPPQLRQKITEARLDALRAQSMQLGWPDSLFDRAVAELRVARDSKR